MYRPSIFHLFFFFNDTATTEIYTLSLHDALPISTSARAQRKRRTHPGARFAGRLQTHWPRANSDRKSTRLNSSHSQISYAVFCLKKKNQPASTPSPRLRSLLDTFWQPCLF